MCLKGAFSFFSWHCSTKIKEMKESDQEQMLPDEYLANFRQAWLISEIKSYGETGFQRRTSKAENINYVDCTVGGGGERLQFCWAQAPRNLIKRKEPFFCSCLDVKKNATDQITKRTGEKLHLEFNIFDYKELPHCFQMSWFKRGSSLLYWIKNCFSFNSYKWQNKYVLTVTNK